MNPIWIPLNPPVPLITEKGKGYASFILDYGMEHNIIWFVCLSEGKHAGEFWCIDNCKVRAQSNYTLGRP